MVVVGKRNAKGYLRVEYTGLIVNHKDLKAMFKQGIKFVKFFDLTEGELIVEKNKLYVRRLKDDFILEDGTRTKGYIDYPYAKCGEWIKGILMGKNGVYVAERKQLGKPLKTTGKGYIRKF